jgi:PPPDE putative peptidase domain
MEIMPVHLRIYDLSMGMAKSLSRSVLGHQIDLIPHTGVQVFGYEFFYQGGLQHARLEHMATLMPMQPIEVLHLGNTGKTLSDVLAFVDSLKPKYSPEAYHLFDLNCNHFSKELVHFLVGEKFPVYIEEIPQRVKQTPMGESIYRMMSSMQQQTPSGTSAIDPFAMFGNAGPAPPSRTAPPAAPARVRATPAKRMVSEFARPNISIEGDAKEYFKFLSNACDQGKLTIDGNVAVTLEELEVLRSALIDPKETFQGLNVPPSQTIQCSHFNEDRGESASSSATCVDHSTPSSKAVHLLHVLIHRNSNHSSILMQLLSILRLSAFSAPESPCLSSLDRDLIDMLKLDSSILGVNHKIVIASTLSNRFAYFNSLLLHPKTAQLLVELLLDGLSPKHTPALRQMIAILAFNVASTIPVDLSEGMSDIMTQLLCYLLEKIEEEKDSTVLEYKLATIGKILLREGEASISLVIGLNLEEGLFSLSTRPGFQVAPFASEILSLLRV